MSASIDYPAIIAALENELVNLITESLWQLERIAEVQQKLRAMTARMEEGLANLALPPLSTPGSLN